MEGLLHLYPGRGQAEWREPGDVGHRRWPTLHVGWPRQDRRRDHGRREGRDSIRLADADLRLTN